MLRFLEAYLDPPRAPLAGPLERIQQPRHPMARGMGMGLGCLLVRSREPAGPLLWHNGFRSFVGVLRERGIAVVVLSNTAWSVDRLGFRLVRALSTGRLDPEPGQRGNRVSSASGPGSLKRSLRRYR